MIIKTPEEIIKDRFRFYDPDIYGKDVELNGETVIELMKVYHAQFPSIAEPIQGEQHFLQMTDTYKKAKDRLNVAEQNRCEYELCFDKYFGTSLNKEPRKINIVDHDLVGFACHVHQYFTSKKNHVSEPFSTDPELIKESLHNSYFKEIGNNYFDNWKEWSLWLENKIVEHRQFVAEQGQEVWVEVPVNERLPERDKDMQTGSVNVACIDINKKIWYGCRYSGSGRNQL